MKRSLFPVFFLLLTLCGCAKTEQQTIFAMNTVMEFSVHDEAAEDTVARMTQRINALEALLSRTREESEVSALNTANGAETPISFEVWSLLDTARAVTNATDGAFDVTIAPIASAWGFAEEAFRVPSREELDALAPLVNSDGITLAQSGSTYLASLQPGQAVDLGGIAKGYASDCIADIFLEDSIKSGYASLGGNILAWGGKNDGSPWRVGVKDPSNTEALCGVLELRDAYAVTSGGYERFFEENGVTYHHIIDPATGAPAESDLLSVTVVMDREDTLLEGRCGSGTLCDALSTALFVMGEDAALDFWRSGGYDLDLVLVTADGRIISTPGVAFAPVEESGYSYEAIS